MKRPWARALGIYAAVALVVVTAVLMPEYLYNHGGVPGFAAWLFFRLPPAYLSVKAEDYLWPGDARYSAGNLGWFHNTVAIAYWLIFLTPLLGWLRTRKVYFLVGLVALLAAHVAFVVHFVSTSRWS